MKGYEAMFYMHETRAVPSSEISFINHQYLHGCHDTSDPTMVWGTDVDAEELLAFVKRCNDTSEVLISVAHVLIKAVAQALVRFPDLNCRIVGGRIYRFRDVNIRMISYDPKTSDVDILTFLQADQAKLSDIGRFLWDHQLQLATGEYADRFDKEMLGRFCPVWLRRSAIRWFWWLDRNFRLPRIGRIDRHLDSSVIVNYLAYADAPPMRMYKPSKFTDETSLLSVTMGRMEQMPVVRGGRVVAGRVAPLFVRGDHRVTDAHRLSHFVHCLREFLEHPHSLEEPSRHAVEPPKSAA
jgi:hypothetical protein